MTDDVAQDDQWIIRDWVTAVVVSLFTLVMAFMAIILLASTLTQTRLSSISIDGIGVTVWKLNFIRQNWSLLEKQLGNQNSALAEVDIRRTASDSHRSKATENLGVANARIGPLDTEFNFQVAIFDADLAHRLNGKGPLDYWSQIRPRRTQLEKDHPELKPLIASISSAYTKWEPAFEEHEQAEAEGKALATEIDELTKSIATTKSGLVTVLSPVKDKPSEADISKIESALYELDPTDDWVGGTINKLVTWQPEILTLSLVIFMGLLGSSLQITNSVFKGGGSRNFGSYFIQICVGAIAALVIFVVAKAGVPLVADASKFGGDAPINPYFISFLAIISGLLSERAIASVQMKAGTFFGPAAPDEPDRWIREDLTAKLREQNISLANLATYLATEQKNVESIVKGALNAKPEQQRIIAIYLRENVRDLFTDIPPATMPA